MALQDLVVIKADGLHRQAGQVMDLLLACTPNQGTRCDQAARVGAKIRKL